MGVTHTDVNIKTMSHNIRVYLLKREEIRNEKLDSILDDKKSKIKFTELGEGILATTKLSKNFMTDKTVAEISTDYFGGMGDQSASLYVNGKLSFSASDQIDPSSEPINEVLRLMGVKKKGNMDEFDTIGLGKYRANRDFKH